MKLGNDDIFRELSKLITPKDDTVIFIMQDGEFTEIIHTTKDKTKFLVLDILDGDLKQIDPNRMTRKNLINFLLDASDKNG